MIMFKCVAVFLAVNAFTALVRSTGNHGRGVMSLESCIRLVAGRLEIFPMEQDLMQLVLYARKNYKNSFERILEGDNAEYREAMANLVLPHHICLDIFGLAMDNYDFPGCRNFIVPDDDTNSFLLKVAKFSDAAKERIEALRACDFAGGPSRSSDDNRDLDSDSDLNWGRKQLQEVGKSKRKRTGYE